MTNRERALAVLRFQPYDRMPLVHFGFWDETLEKWAREGRFDPELARTWGDGNPSDVAITAKLGFDYNYYSCFHPATGMVPAFERKVVR